MGESESFGCSCGDFCGGSCGFSVCVLAESPGVVVVTDVLVSLSSLGVLGDEFFWVLIVSLVSRSHCELIQHPGSL